MEGSADWTALPADVVGQISGRIVDPQDFLSFRLACKPWHEAVPRHAHGHFQPWIVEKAEEGDDSGNVMFYSLASGNYHLIHVRALEGKRVAGHGAGLLLGIDMDDELSAVLVNPLTGKSTEPPRLPECFTGTFTYGFATDPRLTAGEADVFVFVYNWPTVQVRSNVALWRRGGASAWATIPAERFWRDMPRHRERLVTHGPQLLQHIEEAAALANGHAPGEMAWVPGMAAAHVIEHQGRVRMFSRQELLDVPGGGGPVPPRANFVLHEMIGHDGGGVVAWADAPELRGKIILQSEDCSCFVLAPASDFPDLCTNCIYFLSWERREEVNLEDDGSDGDDDDDDPFSYYLCKWDVLARVATVVKRIPGFWDRVKPGMWFMPTLAN